MKIQYTKNGEVIVKTLDSEFYELQDAVYADGIYTLNFLLNSKFVNTLLSKANKDLKIEIYGEVYKGISRLDVKLNHTNEFALVTVEAVREDWV